MKKLLIGVAGLFLLAVIAVAGLSWHPALADIVPPTAASFSSEQIQKGAILAGIGNCAACHTAQGGAQFAGGLAIATPFGKVYSSNLTPDPETGIGHWSQEAFKRAVREGVRKDGAHLFPAFPYTYFSHIDDDDIGALYAYFMTRPAVKQVAKETTLPFPLNVRALQFGWKLLYFDHTALRTDSSKSVDWNRGHYLAEGLGHCAACHTPRNSLGGELKGARYLGADIDGWFAPSLTSTNLSPLPWAEPEIYAYLRTGVTQWHGAALGPMAEVVHDGLAAASDTDIHALAGYFAELNGTASATVPVDAKPILANVLAQSAKLANLSNDHGTSLYVAACASCHSNSNGSVNTARPELGLSSTLVTPNPSNLVQVILYGVDRHEGVPGLMMPGFAAALSNADVAQLVAYLRSSRTALPPWQQIDSKVAEIRQAHQP